MPTPAWGWISRKCLHTSNLCNLLSLKAAYLCVHVYMQSEQSSHSPPNRQPLLPTVPDPPVPHSKPISSRPPPSEGDQAQRPPGGMLDPGGLLRQPGSLTALPWAPPSPPLQRSSESCRFSASSFPLSRASPYATKHDPADLYFWLHFNPMLCVCVVFLWSSIVCSCKFCFTTCLYKAIRESAVNGSKRWELDEEIDALCLGICIPPAV